MAVSNNMNKGCLGNRIKDFGSFEQKILNGYYIAILIKVMKINHLDV